jgi:hypothetical protein
MALTDDHSVARVATSPDQKTQVVTVPCRDLRNGDLILVREGAERDIVRDMAEQLAGRETYLAHREHAGHWRRALKGLGLTPEKLRPFLAAEGLDRGVQALRHWLSEDGPIGPADPERSLPLIAAALGENSNGAVWRACLAGIQAIRGYHVHAGFHLTQMLMAECGDSIMEHSEHETPFELSLGLVWLLEIEEIDTERRDWPYTRVNRIQWDSDSWRQRLLRRRTAGSVSPTASDQTLETLMSKILQDLLDQAEDDAWPE